MHDLKQFEGTIGMAVEHDEPLIATGRTTPAWIELGSGERWRRRVGTLLFGADGRKRSFELADELREAVRQVGMRQAEWTGTEISTKRLPPELSLARAVSRLADQVRDMRDVEWYAENPVHLPHTGEMVLRTSF